MAESQGRLVGQRLRCGAGFGKQRPFAHRPCPARLAQTLLEKWFGYGSGFDIDQRFCQKEPKTPRQEIELAMSQVARDAGVSRGPAQQWINPTEPQTSFMVLIPSSLIGPARSLFGASLLENWTSLIRLNDCLN
jgi:hypothetical protein